MNNGAKIKAIGILFVLSLVFGIILLFSPARAISHSNVDAILAPGTVVNTKMKSLAGEISDLGLANKYGDVHYSFPNETIVTPIN